MESWLIFLFSHDPPAFLKKRQAFVRKVRMNETPCLSLLMLAAKAWNTEPPTSPHFQHQHMVTNRSPGRSLLVAGPHWHHFTLSMPVAHTLEFHTRALITLMIGRFDLCRLRNLIHNFWVWMSHLSMFPVVWFVYSRSCFVLLWRAQWNMQDIFSLI